MKKLIIVCIIVVTVSALAQGQVAKRVFDPAERAGEIAPFIDEQTIVVMHLDLNRVDIDAIVKKLKSIAGDIGVSEAERKMINPVQAMSSQWRSAFLKAGGRDIYVIISLADIPRDPFLIVAPLGKDADVRAILGLLYNGRADGPTTRPTPKDRHNRSEIKVRKLNNAVVRCESYIMERLGSIKPHPRAELESAFKAAGDTTAQILLLPTKDNRRVIEAMMPMLPRRLGGGPSTAITRGVMWAAIGLDGPPKMSLRMTIQSQDTASATSLRTLIVKGLKGLGSIPEVKEVGLDVGKFAAAITPRLSGNSLTLAIDEKEMDALIVSVFTPALMKARKSAKIALSVSYLKGIGTQMYIYRSSNNDTFPPDLKFAGISPKMLVSPLSKKAYVYIRPPKGADGGTIMVYDDPSKHGMKKTGVLYVDTHVGQMPVDKRFNEMVENAKAASEKAYGK